MINEIDHCDSRRDWVNSGNWDLFRFDTDPVDELDCLRSFGATAGSDAKMFLDAISTTAE
jgi:hypothetical protein